MATRKTSDAKVQAAKAGAKVPADYKAPDVPFDQMPGHDLLVPMNEISILDGMPLIEAAEKIKQGEGEVTMSEVKEILRVIQEDGFVKDEERFKEFAVMSNFGPFLELIMAYIEDGLKDVA